MKQKQKKKGGRQSVAAEPSPSREDHEHLEHNGTQMVLSDVGEDGVDADVGAGPLFIRKAAQTPGNAAVFVADKVDSGDLDEVVAMVRVRSADGTESSQAIFKSEQARSSGH
jgi:hypothetical protein